MCNSRRYLQGAYSFKTYKLKKVVVVLRVYNYYHHYANTGGKLGACLSLKENTCLFTRNTVILGQKKSFFLLSILSKGSLIRCLVLWGSGWQGSESHLLASQCGARPCVQLFAKKAEHIVQGADGKRSLDSPPTIFKPGAWPVCACTFTNCACSLHAKKEEMQDRIVQVFLLLLLCTHIRYQQKKTAAHRPHEDSKNASNFNQFPIDLLFQLKKKGVV